MQSDGSAAPKAPAQAVESKETAAPVSFSERVAKSLAWMTGFYSRKQVIHRSAMSVYSQCIEQAKIQEFYSVCGLPDTFQSWFLVTQLHLWMWFVN